MAEIQLSGTTALTESGGAITLNNVDSATNRTNLGLGSFVDTNSSQTLTNKTLGSGVVFPSGVFLDVAHFQHTAAAGTSGGTSSTTWATRTINTTKKSATWASLSSNVITLSSGTYWFFADPSANNSGRIMARLYNNSDTTIDAYSRTVFSNSGEVPAYAFINHIFTISGSKDFVVQMRCQSSKATSGYGIDFSFVDNTITNVYMNVIITKLQ